MTKWSEYPHSIFEHRMTTICISCFSMMVAKILMNNNSVREYSPFLMTLEYFNRRQGSHEDCVMETVHKAVGREAESSGPCAGPQYLLLTASLLTSGDKASPNHVTSPEPALELWNSNQSSTQKAGKRVRELFGEYHFTDDRCCLFQPQQIYCYRKKC